ncbi:hypothetical protein B0T18DRAFT_487176 [Schizothecium vesticola]|uniref:Uncharacterized protein n=1 Tax=Schizothecium vesticola TaxID=314040 RepID=A0AA40F142_9PEZI|nr:hypothetical protein B0T18DRAFT_487176 [Schizothecium vesticola]
MDTQWVLPAREASANLEAFHEANDEENAQRITSQPGGERNGSKPGSPAGAGESTQPSPRPSRRRNAGDPDTGSAVKSEQRSSEPGARTHNSLRRPKTRPDHGQHQKLSIPWEPGNHAASSGHPDRIGCPDRTGRKPGQSRYWDEVTRKYWLVVGAEPCTGCGSLELCTKYG